MVCSRVLPVILTLVCWCCLSQARDIDGFQHSLVLMGYDVGRDVSLVETVPFTTTEAAFTPQQYADALAARPEMEFTASGQDRYWFRDPVAIVRGDTLSVNYRDACTEQSMSSAESMRFWTRFASWFWVPGIRQVRFYAGGKAVTWVGEGSIEQPLPRPADLFLYSPDTREVGIDWQDTAIMPTRATLNDALHALHERRQHRTSRPTGFEPLLPPGMTAATPEYPGTPPANSGGVLHVDLPAAFPRQEQGRLAGIVMMLTQFPEVRAVRFTFNGKTVNDSFMLTTLDKPVTPYDLEFPAG